MVSIPSLLCLVVTSPHAVESPNFTIQSADTRVNCDHVAQQCETWRTWLFKKWAPDKGAVWQPQCVVRIHLSRESYIECAGRGSSQTSGTSSIRFSAGRVVQRRIDLLVMPDGRLTALPHELTHVVLADVFGGHQPPRWADEGIATLADPERKRSLHRRDFRAAVANGTAIRIGELFTLDRLSSHQMPAFYGQSLVLARFLAERKQPQQLVRFVRLGMDAGYDRAARVCYGFKTIADLERAWLRHESLHQEQEEHEGRSTRHNAGLELEDALREFAVSDAVTRR